MRTSMRIFGATMIAIMTSFTAFIWWSDFHYYTPYGVKDFFVRLLSCLLGAAAARLILQGGAYPIVLSIVVVFGIPDALKIFSFETIDWYPFENYLSFRLALIAWLLQFVLAAVVGSMLGQWLGKQIKNSWAKAHEPRENFTDVD